MMRTSAVLMMVAAIGCGGKGDECQQFLDKAGPTMGKMMQASGKSFGDAERKQLLEMCRTQPTSKDAPEFKCVLAARDDAAVAACFESALKDYMGKSKASEARLMLNRLGKTAKVYYAEQSTLPKGKTGPFPAEPCCNGPDHKCAVADWSKDPVWATLDFQVDEPTRYQYTYESDGQAARATAIGDLDCDGEASTYTLDITVNNGMVETKITEPEKLD